MNQFCIDNQCVTMVFICINVLKTFKNDYMSITDLCKDLIKTDLKWRLIALI